MKTLVSKLEENGSSSENLVSGFRKCGLYPFIPNAVFQKLPSENVMSPRKALDESLLQQLQSMRECPVGEETPQNNKTTQLMLHPGNQSVILILSPVKVSQRKASPRKAMKAVQVNLMIVMEMMMPVLKPVMLMMKKS